METSKTEEMPIIKKGPFEAQSIPKAGPSPVTFFSTSLNVINELKKQKAHNVNITFSGYVQPPNTNECWFKIDMVVNGEIPLGGSYSYPINEAMTKETGVTIEVDQLIVPENGQINITIQATATFNTNYTGIKLKQGSTIEVVIIPNS